MNDSTTYTTDSNFDWERIVRLFLTSRAIDSIEENELYPQKKIPYQFSARGHELGQILLGMLLTNRHDGATVYYRCRPLLLTAGLSLEDAFAASLVKSGGLSDGRDIGTVFNLPSRGSLTILPMAGDVGAQYTPAAGWAQSMTYRQRVLDEKDYQGSIAVALGGDGSVAANGFWSSLTMATTLKLPMLFYIEDNGFAISVPSDKQTPGGNIAANLRSFGNLHILEGDGTNPKDVSSKLTSAVAYVRKWEGPALLRLTVPRLCGHSGQDTQSYKSKELIEQENAQDPLLKLRAQLVPEFISLSSWSAIENEVEKHSREALELALERSEPKTDNVIRHVFCETKNDGSPDIQIAGGLAPQKHVFPTSSSRPESESTRSNMLKSIRRTLEAELTSNPKMLLFGEDVGQKGGVHAATLDFQDKFGEDRVFDTSLSEEGIIGRAVGMAIAGLMPVAEIQFRKYADPAAVQLNNCGTIRWRTSNRFAAPIVVRMPGGFSKSGDPWHSVSDEVRWVHAVGWQVVFPSNAEDAAGLLRAALRDNNPTIFFEHRLLLDAACARRPYPGDNFILPLGKARITQAGNDITVVCWGAMVDRCERAAEQANISAEVIDLRTIYPWDKEAVIASVKKTARLLIVHEDTETAGFGAEISAVMAHEAFHTLEAPIERLTTPDVPLPCNAGLMNAVIPSVEQIAQKMQEIVTF